ncbi:MAG: hypothetical protein AB1726_12310 [Planctomycetota bacterium]
MNRTTVILLALAILLAHTLAIHQTPDGAFGAPYEIAHVAFRTARNLVRAGVLTWNPASPPVESHPSPLWVAVALAAEFRYVSPILVSQTLGILGGLSTAVILTQFSPRRMAGLIAPLLLAASGTAAAAGASGTEAPVAMLLVTTAFLAFEWGWRRLLALSLAALVWTRPEGLAVLLLFLLLERFDRPRAADGGPRGSLAPWDLVPAAAAAALVLSRHALFGTWISPFGASFFAPAPARILLGGRYLASYLVASGAGPLLFLPIGLLVTGQLSPRGRRALILSLGWAGAVAISGGDGLPFWNALAAVVPLSLLSIQEAITGEMDRRPRLYPLAWTVLVIATGFSFLASKVPGDVGPLRLDAIHRAWMRPSAGLAAAYPRPFGRLGLLQELREIEHLRPLGIFLRDNVKEPSSIATFWPGAVGYLSRKEVFDLLGRTCPAPGREGTVSWRGAPRVDLVRGIEQGADYVVPLIGSLAEGKTAVSFLEEWTSRYDSAGGSPERIAELLAALARYELISVPVPPERGGLDSPATRPFLLLRKKDLGLTPRLEVRREGRWFEVRLHHRGHREVVELSVRVEDGAGGVHSLRPTGEWVAGGAEITARTGILLYETGPRPILLVRGLLPDGVPAGTLSARLHNPAMKSSAPLSAVGPAVQVSF